jgi:hypothetical protein
LPPVNGSSTSLLTVQSDPTVQSGEYKFKVTASSADFSDKSVSVKLEVVGQNLTAPAEEEVQFDPVALTPVVIKDMQDSIIDDVSSKRMILISTTVNNNYDKTQPFIVIVEVRDNTDETTLYLQLQKGVLNPFGEVEVAISWILDKAGMYQIRTFAIDELDAVEFAGDRQRYYEGKTCKSPDFSSVFGNWTLKNNVQEHYSRTM